MWPGPEGITSKPWHIHKNSSSSGDNFYPNLAEVGKEILKERAWRESAVARRFVQCSGCLTALNRKNNVRRGSTDETIGGQLPSRATPAPVFVGPPHAIMGPREVAGTTA